jgi:hypothetical protein
MKSLMIAVTGLISLWATPAGAISPIASQNLRAVHQTPLETVACVGFRYRYRSFNSCMKANRFNAKHCNRICAP